MYRYTNLTNALKDRDSPLRSYLGTRFPNTRPLLTQFRDACGELLVDAAVSASGTVGSAFDFQTRFTLDPGYDPGVAKQAFANYPQLVAAIDGVRNYARDSVSRVEADSESLARACWALALTTEVYRMGVIRPGTAIHQLLDRDTFTTDSLMSVCPPAAVGELAAFKTVADERFVAALKPQPQLALGPTFDGSELCAADADIIADGVLIDLKSSLGSKDKAGKRHGSLSTNELYQLMLYLLFDHSDRYKITSIGIYAARYGCLLAWPVTEAMDVMSAGQAVDLSRERTEVWRLLGGS